MHGSGIPTAANGSVIEQIIIAIVVILVSAFFVGAETALVALRSSRIKQIESTKAPRDKWLLRLVKNPSEWLGAVQLGITLVNFIGGAAVIAVIAPIIAPFFDAIVPGYGTVLSYLVVTTAFMYLILIFGELVPKYLAFINPESMARWFAPILVVFIWITYPFVWFVSVSTVFFARPFTKGKLHQEDVTAQEIEYMILTHEQIPHFEKKLATRIFMFSDTVAHEIMTPRTDVYALPCTVTISQLREVALDSGHSRIPIYKDAIDNLIGVVVLKDVFLDREISEDSPITNWIRRDVPFVPETLPILKLYTELARTHMHMAFVIDEHGGTAGVVTIEDVVEEVFGEIQDEHDTEGVMWIVDGQGVITCNGMAAVRHLNHELDLNLPEGDGYETVAGLVMDQLGIVPKGGESLEVNGIGIEVVDVKGNRIVHIKLRRIKHAEV